MEHLIINNQDCGMIQSRRYNRVDRIDGIYNDWHFLMDGGYFVKVEGHNIKRFLQYADKDGRYLQIETFG